MTRYGVFVRVLAPKNWLVNFGAMAEGLGKGLQNLLHQFKSGSRLVLEAEKAGIRRKARRTRGLAGMAELADAQDLKS